MIRIGILGYGYWGQLLAMRAMALPMARVVAIADHDAHQRRKAELLPNVIVVRTLDDLLQERLSALIVATPASTHEAVVATSLAEGMHVFCEKPLALSFSASAQLLVTAAQRARVLHVDHTFLFTEQFKHIAAVLRGDPLRFYRSRRLNVGPGRDDVSILEDLAIHDLALLDALTADEPEAVSLRATDWPSPESATLTMRFTRGCTASIKVGWRQASKCRRIALGGSLTCIVWRDHALTVRRHHTGQVVRQTFDQTHSDALTGALFAFLRCIETSTLTNLEAARAARIALTIERIRASVPVEGGSHNA
jgi:predicted dehydrogenase